VIGLAEEVAKHRSILENDYEYGNLFDSDIALWSISETFPWSHTTKLLLKALRRIPTRAAIERALNIAWHWLKALAAVDHSGVKFMVPAFLLRLERDQEAYDFLKWFATKGREPLYGARWEFDLNGEDVTESLGQGGWDLEAVQEWRDEDKYGDQELLSPLVAGCLVKLRAWTNLLELDGARKALNRKLPREIVDSVREYYLAGEVVMNRQDVVKDMRDGLGLTPRINMIEAQVDGLFAVVQRRNKHFWSLLLDPGTALAEMKTDWEDERREAIDTLQHNYDAWRETPRAIDWVRKKMGQHT
jgi:hypothetical protein